MTGLNPRLVETDIYNLPDDLGYYDLALVTIGVLNWMPDLQRFFQIACGLLIPQAILAFSLWCQAHCF